MEQTPKRSPWKILIIDDDEEDYFLTRQMLADAKGGKHSLDWASSFEEGWRMLQAGSYDAVLMDYDLGAHSGLDLTRRAVAEGYPAPVILYTGRGSYELDQEALQAGATLYLTKGETSALMLERSIRYAIEHKRIQDSLRASEQRFRDLFEAMHESFYVCEVIHDAAGAPVDIRYLECNPTCAEMVGHTREEIVGHTYLELFPSNAAFQSWLPRLAQVAETGQPQHFEQYSEVRERYFDVDAYSPGLGRVAVLMNDITTSKRAEQALRASEQRFRDLFEAMREVFFVCEVLRDAAGTPVDLRYVEANPACYTRARRTRAEMVGHTYLELFPPNPTFAIWLERFGQVEATGEPQHFEQYAAATGFYFDVDAYSPEQGRVAVLMNDITTSKRAEQALRQGEQRWATTLASIGDAVIATDLHSNILFMNPVAEELTGWSLPEATMVPVQQVFHIISEQTRQPVTDPVAQVLAQGQVVGLANHTLLVRRDGSEIPIDDSAAPIQDDDGNVLGVVMVFRDISERRRVSEQLRASEQQLVDFIENTHDTFFTLDREWRIAFANRRLIELLGRDAQELIGRPYFEALPAYAGSIVESYYRKVFEERRPVHFQIGGQYTGRWFDVSVYPTRDGIAVFGADRTEERRASEALREREEILRLALSAGKTGVFSWNLKTNSMHWSEEYYHIFGFEPGAQAPAVEAWASRLHPEDRVRMNAVVQAALAQGKPIDATYRVIWPDGSLHWVHSISHTFYDAAGQPERMTGIAIDISAQKQTEQVLAESALTQRQLAEALEVERAKLAAAIDHLPLGVGIGDANGMTLSLNAAGLKLHGFQSEAEMFSRLERYVEEFELRYADGRVMPVEAWPASRAIRGEYVQDYELILHNKMNDVQHILSYSVAPVRSSQGEVVLIVYVMQDMTERKRAEAQIKDHAERLERSNRDLEEFAYVASHDLQEPLRKIEAFGSALLVSADTLDPKQIDYLDRMRRAAERMRRLVDDLLALSRVERQSRPFVVTDLGQVVLEVLSTLELQLKRTGGQVEVGKLPTIEADARQMQQLLQNLLGNALKFHREDAPPHVRVYAAEHSPGRVAIAVADNGIGFPPSEAERIFQPFQRLHARSDYDGTGIGLAICKKIAERHGGKIEVKSQPGEGAVFTVVLPVRQG